MSLRPLAIALLALSTSLSPALLSPAFAAETTVQPGVQPGVPPAAHRALYELVLESSKGPDVTGAHGSMAYELTDACDGWATRQRLALTVGNREGQDVEMVSDYATWESKDGRSMRFRMRQTTDTAVTEQAEGEAKLAADGSGTIHYTVPEEKDVAVPKGTVFPMAHTDAILSAAAAGKKFLALPIFDGTGTKGAQDSSVVIINWGGPGSAPYPALATLPNGRVRIAFFDREAGADKSDKPMGSPDYEVGMKYWANGVADDLHMDFGDFVMQGKLKEFVLQPPHC